MKITAFGGSTSRQSINKKFATHAAERLGDRVAGAEVEVLDLNDFPLPLYSIDLEHEGGIPDATQAFLDKIEAADALVISLAEHNGSFTAAFKNLIDWCSRVRRDIFQKKPTVLLSTSPGKGGGASVMAQASKSFPFFAAEVKATLSVPSFGTSFNVDAGELVDPDLAARLGEALATLEPKTDA
ncbi:MAG: NAD(P)H-dependent oxidoreductase [Acidobacteriota bacterium]